MNSDVHMTIRICAAANLVFISLGGLSGQDIHFSQFNETSTFTNPALTGFPSHIRAAILYRDQWRSVSSPFKTFYSGIEFRTRKAPPESHAAVNSADQVARNLSFGINFFSDRSGDGILGSSQVNLNIATRVIVSRKSALSAGIQSGIGQRSVNYAALVWPSQYNGTGYDNSIASGEANTANSNFYFDLGAGLLYTYGKGEMYMTANNSFKANFGLSAFHLNRPSAGLMANSADPLRIRFVTHGGMAIGLRNSNVCLAPSFMINLQLPSKEILVNLLYKYRLNQNSIYTGYVKSSFVSFGMGYRNEDALVPQFLFESGQYAVGFSYDVNISSLRAASSFRGGLEIILRYTGAEAFLYQNKPRL